MNNFLLLSNNVVEIYPNINVLLVKATIENFTKIWVLDLVLN